MSNTLPEIIDDSTLETERSRISTAILRIYKIQTFFRHLLLNVPMEEDLEVQAPCWVKHDETGGSSIGLSMGNNPKFIREITDNVSLRVAFIHEVYHIVLKHYDRGKKMKIWCEKGDRIFSHQLWNIACDLSINDMLIEWSSTDCIELFIGPDSWFFKNGCHTKDIIDDKGINLSRFSHLPSGKSAEWYFKQLCEENDCTEGSKSELDEKIKDILDKAEELAQEGGVNGPGHEWMEQEIDGPAGQSDGDGEGEGSGSESGEGSDESDDGKSEQEKLEEALGKGAGKVLSELEKTILEDKVKEALSEAKKSTKSIGNKHFMAELDKQYPIKVVKYNWGPLLDRGLRTGKFTESKLTIKRPQRRWNSIPDKLIPVKFPSRSKVPDFVVKMIIDTSGSMSSEDILHACERVVSLKAHKPKMVFKVIEWDCAMGAEYDVNKMSDVTTKVSGRGGTEFSEAIKYAAETKPRPDTIIYMTDGYGNSGTKDIVRGINFIWLITKSGVSPCDWGLHIPLELSRNQKKLK